MVLLVVQHTGMPFLVRATNKVSGRSPASFYYSFRNTFQANIWLHLTDPCVKSAWIESNSEVTDTTT